MTDRKLAERLAANAETDKRLRAILNQPATHKRCARCKASLPVENFRPQGKATVKNPLGLHSWCDPCRIGSGRQWREANPDYVNAYNAERRAKYVRKRRRTRTAEEIRLRTNETARLRRLANPERFREYDRNRRRKETSQ